MNPNQFLIFRAYFIPNIYFNVFHSAIKKDNSTFFRGTLASRSISNYCCYKKSHRSLETRIMDKITKIWFGPLPPDSPYVKPFRLHFIQNGVEKNWDLLKVHDSVSIIIFNKTRNNLVFVKQFRPAVYHGIVSAAEGNVQNIDLEKYPPSLGITLELCAGIVDKDKSWAEIAREEVLEECGYDVPVERLEMILTFRSGVGSQGAQQTMFYCEVTDDDKTASGGGGVDDELIEVIEYNLDEARKLVSQGTKINSPPSFLLGVLWFLSNKAKE